ncbi:MAG: alpha/beta hydrolase [Rhodobacteraceae bacterium]|jgi:haloacetate dehalogenase|nr:alpha/beta hydrolase [Paracoccaceae bacterium]
MSDPDDLFPGFSSHWIDTDAGRIFARAAGSGPPVALIHGFPQTHVEWHGIAPALAGAFSVVAMDLRGYGRSATPPSTGGEGYSKRAMAGDILGVMAALGHPRFAAVGHDRGARVAYRMALDHPGRIERLVLMDILPTVSMWEGMNAARAMQVYHWTFLAQPHPLPETLLAGATRAYLDHVLAKWTAARTLAAFDPRALAHYRAVFAEPARIHAACEDYRAGAGADLDHDRADLAAGRTIACPTLVLWGGAGVPAASSGPLEVWRATFAPHAAGQAIDAGHFLPEENPQATLSALLPFLHAG